MKIILALDCLELEIKSRTMSMAAIHDWLTEIEKRFAPESVGNVTTVIQDIYGRLTFVLYHHHAGCTLYAFTGTNSLMTLDRYPTSQEINKWSVRLWQGEYYCDHCKTWSDRGTFHHYSFAGMVCAKCYDPKKHLQPDTRGD